MATLSYGLESLLQISYNINNNNNNNNNAILMMTMIMMTTRRNMGYMAIISCVVIWRWWLTTNPEVGCRSLVKD